MSGCFDGIRCDRYWLNTLKIRFRWKQDLLDDHSASLLSNNRKWNSQNVKQKVIFQRGIAHAEKVHTQSTGTNVSHLHVQRKTESQLGQAQRFLNVLRIVWSVGVENATENPQILHIQELVLSNLPSRENGDAVWKWKNVMQMCQITLLTIYRTCLNAWNQIYWRVFTHG